MGAPLTGGAQEERRSWVGYPSLGGGGGWPRGPWPRAPSYAALSSLSPVNGLSRGRSRFLPGLRLGPFSQEKVSTGCKMGP